jgi:probable HAF family extracellular repeat protein
MDAESFPIRGGRLMKTTSFAIACLNALGLATACITSAIAQKSSTTPIYSITSIGPVGSAGTHPFAVNDRGQAVGLAYNQSGTSSYRAFLYDLGNPAAGVQILPGFVGSTTTQANGINHAGQVVGYCTCATGAIAAFLWDAANGTRQIDRIADTSGATAAGMGWNLGLARAINARGDILCRDFVLNQMCIWRMQVNLSTGVASLSVTAVPNQSGWSYTDLNDNGVVLTDALNPAVGAYSFGLWDSNADSFTTFFAPSFKQGYALNNYGVAVSHYGQIYRPGIGVSLLGSLGSGNAEGWDVNDSNQVVGISGTANRANVAFLWQNGVMRNLQSLTDAGNNWNLSVASGMSNVTNAAGAAGYIVGWGAYSKQAAGWILAPR